MNKALQELVTELRDPATWEQVLEVSGTDEEGFIGMDPYPDELTFALLDATARTLELDVDELLEAFGEHWVAYTAREGYGDLLDMAGTRFDRFLPNLHRIHDRLLLSFPGLRSPEFSCTARPDGAWLVEYRSTRRGLAPMVAGVLRGLARRFGEGVRVEHLSTASDGGTHAFLVSAEVA